MSNISTSKELVVIYDWDSVRVIWEKFQRGKIGMQERDKMLEPYRKQLHLSMSRRESSPQHRMK